MQDDSLYYSYSCSYNSKLEPGATNLQLNPQLTLSTANCNMSDFTDQLKPRYDGVATLQAERDGSTINVKELAKHLLSRDGFLERQEKVVKVLSKDKIFYKDQQMNLSRPERYHLGLARAKAIQRIVRREGWNHEDYRMAEYLNDEMSPYHLHMTMFGTFREGIPCATGRTRPVADRHMLPCSDNDR